VEEILGRAAKRVEIDQARVLAELGKIGFSDIRRAIAWRSNVAVAAIDLDEEMRAIEEGGEIRHQITNQVELISSDEIDDDTAAAIAEISMTDKGGLKVKFHDKRGALVDLGRHLGMFKDRQVHENPGRFAAGTGAPVVIFQLPDNGRGG
jgi:phage terminase small subunit